MLGPTAPVLSTVCCQLNNKHYFEAFVNKESIEQLCHSSELHRGPPRCPRFCNPGSANPLPCLAGNMKPRPRSAYELNSGCLLCIPLSAYRPIPFAAFEEWTSMAPYAWPAGWRLCDGGLIRALCLAGKEPHRPQVSVVVVCFRVLVAADFYRTTCLFFWCSRSAVVCWSADQPHHSLFGHILRGSNMNGLWRLASR